MEYVDRDLRLKLTLFLKTFPVVMIVGPRQSGKSTFVHHELPEFSHFDLERPADFNQVTADMELFLREHPRRLCIDEAQRSPGLFPVLRYAIDSGEGPGRFVLLGSAGPQLMRTAAESLTGRIAILSLMPFSAHELNGVRPWQDRWRWGGLPPVHALDSDEQRREWIGSYVMTVLERDLPALGVRVPSARLMKFWTMLTHLQGELVNVSNLAQSIEMSTTAVGHYLDVLEGSLMIQRLPPYFANIGKRLTKRPKLYIRDTGILHWLTGLRSRDDLDTWPGKVSSFEGLVVGELMARAQLDLQAPRFTFYRTQAGAEVDLLVENGREIFPIEIKHGASVSQYGIAGLRRCMEDLGISNGFIVTRGDSVRRLGNGITVLPWEKIVAGEVSPWDRAAPSSGG